jgi:hypothetical protein
LHIAHVVGKWNEETCNEFYQNIKKRLRKPTEKHKLKIISDGNKQNIESIKNNFDETCVDYAQVIKLRENQIVIALEKRNILGEMSKEDITMHQIDSYCGTLRERIPIYVRKAKSFSKKRQNVEDRLNIYQVYRNFIWSNKKKTPAMEERIVDKIWNWNTLLRLRYYPS